MKASEFVFDAIGFGNFPDKDVDSQFIDSQIYGAVKLSDVSRTLSIWQKDKFLILKKDQSILVGFVKVSEVVILDDYFDHIDLIYILPEFRHTSAIKWLLYAVKEYVSQPIVADGAIFAGGERLIMSLGKYGLAEPKVLNKISGEKSDLIQPINDPNLCYVFESTKLGPGKNYLSENVDNRGPGWVWYAETLFDEIQ